MSFLASLLPLVFIQCSRNHKCAVCKESQYYVWMRYWDFWVIKPLYYLLKSTLVHPLWIISSLFLLKFSFYFSKYLSHNYNCSVFVCVLVAQLYLTLWDSTDCSLSRAWILQWVAISFSYILIFSFSFFVNHPSPFFFFPLCFSHCFLFCFLWPLFLWFIVQ